ncbi:MAG TPA: DUF1365 family protein [Deltaproteobacteria bacterium]|nr:DUF1365 family protein [Deltaproteobacteria bacterium]
MNSCIYVGSVEHIRFKPVWHRLYYSLYFTCIDLDELEEIDRAIPVFGYNRVRLVSLHDGDYLTPGSENIRRKLTAFLEEHGIATPVERIVLVTSARLLWNVFNPVNFYYCYNASGQLECVVAEVNNTFGERHVYPLTHQEGTRGSYPACFRVAKEFHVSPFNDLEGTYELCFSAPGEEIEISIDLYKEGEKAFTARLWGRRRPFETRSLLSVVLSHPLIPHLTLGRIHWEAVKLFFGKKLPLHHKPVPMSPMTIKKLPPTPSQRIFMGMIEGLLSSVRIGVLEVVLPDGARKTFGTPEFSSRAARIMVNDYSFFSRVVLHGEVGFGEAYMEGLWDSENLLDVLKLLIENRQAISDGNIALSALSRFKDFSLHRSRPNTLFGSRENIAAHYDLNNEFFATFLDTRMMYSCGYFPQGSETLDEAQLNKILRVIEKARLYQGDHVLEIGCGWGGFAIEAARRTGCSVRGITVSRKQYEYARKAVQAQGLEDRVEILLQDYRTLEGTYDRIVSIEMLEAVGHEHLGEFFARCDRLLKPDGLMVLQVITVPDQRYDAHRSEPNWIQKHIFPGGVLPSLTSLCNAMTAHSRLQVEDVENIAAHYAETLRHWRERFLGAERQVSGMGFDRSFRRKWEYYLSICEAQFALRVLGDLQVVITREGNRRLGSR